MQLNPHLQRIVHAHTRRAFDRSAIRRHVRAFEKPEPDLGMRALRGHRYFNKFVLGANHVERFALIENRATKVAIARRRNDDRVIGDVAIRADRSVDRIRVDRENGNAFSKR